ncbi:MAG: transporter substrate-binding domain-containing protein [Spirochaetia bacterium]|nr:transporter substrate-binding domain-containing protein [Spirochaetia bacterium]MCF7942220.1 transporter substrate-binding domain-containing protein [Spirochaetia bacterium]
MKKILLTAIMISILTGALLFAGGAQETAERPLVVAMELQYPPFEMSDTDGNPTGISVEIAYALGDYLDRPVVIENIAWTGLIPSLQTGKADIIISSMTITEDRKQAVDFSDPYIKSGLTLLIAKDSPVQTFADLNQEGMVVAVKSGTIGATAAQEKLPLADVRLFDEVAACVLEVSQGKADAFIYDVLTVYENHKKHQNTTRINIESIPGTDGYWGMAIKKGNTELLEEVNAFIAAFRAEGGFSAIADSYLGEQKELFEASGVPFFFDL